MITMQFITSLCTMDTMLFILQGPTLFPPEMNIGIGVLLDKNHLVGY